MPQFSVTLSRSVKQTGGFPCLFSRPFRACYDGRIPSDGGFFIYRMLDEVRTTRLQNGLTILTEHMPELRSVSLGIWLRRGSRHEASAQNGICHFIEHALFKGTQRRSAHDIAAESDRLGGHFDAYTAHEMTGFAAKVVDTEMPRAFDLLADLVLNPRFDQDDLRKEQ